LLATTGRQGSSNARMAPMRGIGPMRLECAVIAAKKLRLWGFRDKRIRGL
jgi:hypothetical protein